MGRRTGLHEAAYCGGLATRRGWDRTDQQRLLAKLLRASLGVARAPRVAAALMNRFGSLPSTLSAPVPRLMEIDGIGERTATSLKVMMEVTQKVAKERLPLDAPILGSWGQLLDYCHAAMAFESVERFRILFLDKKNRLIADEVQQTGTVGHTPVYPREVIRRSLELSATALILVHNHPSGDASPSSADVRVTREISDVAKPLGITLHDHIIIGKSGHASMRGLRLL